MTRIAVDILTSMVTSSAILGDSRILLMLFMAVTAFIDVILMLGWFRKIMWIKHVSRQIRQSFTACRPFCQISIGPVALKTEFFRIPPRFNEIRCTRFYICM